MAFARIQQKIKTEVLTILRQERDKIGMVTGLGDNVILDLTLDPELLSEGLIEGTDKIFDKFLGNSVYQFGHSSQTGTTANRKDRWELACKAVFTTLRNSQQLTSYSGRLQRFSAATVPIKPGVYILGKAKKAGTVDIRFVRKRNPAIKNQRVGDSAVNTFARAVRKALWEEWYTNSFSANSVFYRTGASGPRVIPNTIEQANLTANVTEIGHEQQTTKTLLALDKIKNAEPEMDFEGIFTLTDLFDQILENLDIKLERNTNKTIKGVTFGYIVEASLQKNFAGSEPTDTQPLIEEINKAVKQQIIKKRGYLGLLLAYISGSTPPVEQATDDAVVDIVTKLSKAKTLKKVSLKSKPFKPTKNKGTAKKGKALTASVTQEAMLIRGAGVIAANGRNQTGKKAQKLTPARLRYLINRSLPAEIRRNMGRPALINRTGQFSNSAELVNLRQGPKTMIGEYTYQLDPYSTFENLGTKQWPQGYNPKPLISKSIRNIAERHVREKFTLRRV